MGGPDFDPETRSWYQRAEERRAPFGATQLRRCGRGVYLLTAVAELEREPRSPADVIFGRGQVLFRLSNQARSASINILVKSDAARRRIEFGPNGASQAVWLLGKQPDSVDWMTTGGFPFTVQADGEEEVHTWGEPLTNEAKQRSPNRVQQDPPAQSRFTGRARPDSQFDVFLCHSHEDADEVRGIAATLRKHDVSYWLDAERINPGDSVVEKIQQGLGASRTLAVCLSRHVLKSGWARAEYADVLSRVCGGQGGRRVVPLVLETLTEKEYPALLYDRRAVDARNPAELTSFAEFLRRRDG
jgi:hypothetical protein